MKKFWWIKGFIPGNVKEIIVGPVNDRPGAVKLGNSQSITQEGRAQAIRKQVTRLNSRLLPDVSVIYGTISNLNLVLNNSFIS